MLLPDHEIARLCKQEAMVTPYNDDHLNPASLDVTLGDRIMIEVAGHIELQILGITGHTAEDPFWIQPGESGVVWLPADHGAEEQPPDAPAADLAWPEDRPDEVPAGQRPP